MGVPQQRSSNLVYCRTMMLLLLLSAAAAGAAAMTPRRGATTTTTTPPAAAFLTTGFSSISSRRRRKRRMTRRPDHENAFLADVPNVYGGSGSSRGRSFAPLLHMSLSSSSHDDEQRDMNTNGNNDDDTTEHYDNSSNSNNNSDSNRSAADAVAVRTEKSSSSSSKKNITAAVYKKVLIAEKRAEINRILSGPDAPVDMDAVRDRVVSTAAPVAETLSERELEEKVSKLESDLYAAVKRQDYRAAAERKRAISAHHVDDCGAVLQVNAAFYRAFSEKNYDAMEKLWLRDAAACCIHPSLRPMTGSKTVLSSWKRMFESADGGFLQCRVEPHDIRLAVKGAATATVVCEERVYARRFVRGKKRQTDLVNKLQATNVFRKVDGSWYLFHRHASWHADSDAAKHALGKAGGSTGAAGASAGRRDGRSVSVFRQGGASGSRRRRSNLDDNDNDDDDDEPAIEMDGILGANLKPLLGNGGGAGIDNDNSVDDISSIQRPGQVKRIIMGGSLSDLLNGNLGDLLGKPPSPSAPNPFSSGNGISSSGSGESIISFGRMEEIHDEDDDDSDDDDDDDDVLEIEGLMEDDDDDDDDDDEDDDDSETTEAKAVQIIKEWAQSNKSPASASARRKQQQQQQQHQIRKAAAAVSSSASSSASASSPPKDALRQECISALRKLSDAGQISTRQKRQLLTDIITCSARGEFSMVEVAYELLCGEGDDETAAQAEEEFAEQCRVFAAAAATQVEDNNKSSSGGGGHNAGDGRR